MVPAITALHNEKQHPGQKVTYTLVSVQQMCSLLLSDWPSSNVSPFLDLVFYNLIINCSYNFYDLLFSLQATEVYGNVSKAKVVEICQACKACMEHKVDYSYSLFLDALGETRLGS